MLLFVSIHITCHINYTFVNLFQIIFKPTKDMRIALPSSFRSSIVPMEQHMRAMSGTIEKLLGQIMSSELDANTRESVLQLSSLLKVRVVFEPHVQVLV